MTNKPEMSKEIEALQKNPDFVILNNPLSSPKFVRAISKKESEPLSLRDIYTPKLFYEIASRLKPEDLEHIKTTESIIIEIQTKQFAEAIGATNNNNFYKDLKNTADYLMSVKVPFKGKDGLPTNVGIVTKTKTDEKGKIILFIDGELAQKILEVTDHGNFSFLKEYIFGLQNGQAIKLYPFFKSWVNHGKYETGLDRFKEQFGYNTSGYRFWNNFEAKVLKQAIQEIGNKTDIIVTYETTGENLDGKRPRVTGLIFRITAKNKTKTLPNGQPHAKPTQKVEPTETAAPPPTPQEQPQTVTAQDKATPDSKELYDLFKKITIKQKPDEITASVLIDGWVQLLGFELVKDGFLGMIATKAHPETVAFFTPDNFKKYTGYSKKQEEQEAKKRAEQENRKKEQNKKRLIDEIKKNYEQEKREHFKKKYNELEPDQKAQYIEQVWSENENKKIYFRDGNKTFPNSYAIEKIGELVRFPDGYDSKAMLKNYALSKYNIQINFDQNDEIIID